MPDLYERYQQGFYQEVYDDLLAMQENIDDSHIYEEAQTVMREIMKRVRANTELLLLRLHQMGYLFRKGGFWENFVSREESMAERDFPTFRPPTLETYERIAELEQLAGPLPLSLKYWFAEVGCVNLIGLFPTNKRGYGPILDPLYVESVEMLLHEVRTFIEMDEWEKEPLLLLAPDCYHKYGYSGAGAYRMALPCKAVDAPLLDEPHHTTFVNYLRICFQWGGFPGLEQDCRLSREQLEFLTSDLLPF